VQPQQKGKACVGPTDCQPGDGACPTTSTTTTTTATTATATSDAVTDEVAGAGTNTDDDNNALESAGDDADLAATNTPAPTTSSSNVGLQAGIALSVTGFLIGAAVSIYRCRSTEKSANKQKEGIGRIERKLDSKMANIARREADLQFHFLKGAITRAEAEELLKDGMVGAFLLRDKPGSDSRVISVVTQSSPNIKILHEILTTSSSATKAVLLRTQPIGSPPATTLRDACVEMSRDASILGVALMGVEDENVYGDAVYANSSSAKPNHVYGQAVYIGRGGGGGGGGGGGMHAPGNTIYASYAAIPRSGKAATGGSSSGAPDRCAKCRSRIQFCMCKGSANDRQRARTLSSATGNPKGRARTNGGQGQASGKAHLPSHTYESPTSLTESPV